MGLLLLSVLRNWHRSLVLQLSIGSIVTLTALAFCGLFLYAKPDGYPIFIAGLLALATTLWVRFADKHLLSFLLLQFSSWHNTHYSNPLRPQTLDFDTPYPDDSILSN